MTFVSCAALFHGSLLFDISLHAWDADLINLELGIHRLSAFNFLFIFFFSNKFWTLPTGIEMDSNQSHLNWNFQKILIGLWSNSYIARFTFHGPTMEPNYPFWIYLVKSLTTGFFLKLKVSKKLNRTVKQLEKVNFPFLIWYQEWGSWYSKSVFRIIWLSW